MELGEIKININFENLIPKQTAEQFKQLEENMVAEGRARNPLVLWRGKNILVDGHHRVRILKAHPDLKWSVVEQDFSDEDEAKEWIIKNALGTRHLTEMQFTELTGRLYKMRKSTHGGKRKATPENKELKDTKRGVSEEIAKELGVSHSKIEDAGNFVDGLDAAEKVVPGFRGEVLTGVTKAQKKEIAAMRKQTPEEIKQSVKEIKDRKSAKRKPSDREFYSKLKDIYATASGVTTTQYGLAELIREVDALGDSFIASLTAILKRRQGVIETYDGQDEINNRIDNIIENLNEMKGNLK